MMNDNSQIRGATLVELLKPHSKFILKWHVLLYVMSPCVTSHILSDCGDVTNCLYYGAMGLTIFGGKFAAVRKCTHQQTGVEYAAKFIRKRRRAMDQRHEILHEVAVLRLALLEQAGGRIVRLHEVYETHSEMALILEM
ncbi:hypothetical protein B566_EDAN002497 [Ephemera danica]|nr:hypothetical protein B566_EDAN002497 [Ephemera danica]